MVAGWVLVVSWVSRALPGLLEWAGGGFASALGLPTQAKAAASLYAAERLHRGALADYASKLGRPFSMHEHADRTHAIAGAVFLRSQGVDLSSG